VRRTARHQDRDALADCGIAARHQYHKDADAMNKYNAKQVYEDGHCFDSMSEHRRYRELRLLLAAGRIRDMQVHPVWTISINGELITRYEGDFYYFDLDTQRWICEDVKGVRLPLYMLKKKLMKAVHGIEIVEVQA
jgi:hypothetical protein